MRLLFVHERFGAFGGAEANVLLTASELKRRGHTLGLVHGAATGKEEQAWTETFAQRFAFPSNQTGTAEIVADAIRIFHPDVIFLHKLSDLAALEALADSQVSVVR